MGLFDFVKSAGAKLLGADEPEAAAPQAPTVDPAEVQRANDRRRAMGLVQVIAKLGLEVEDLSVKVEGDVATVSGTASSQADREKLVLVVGNTAGIAQVDDQMTVEAPEPEATFYTVQSGDSLSKIAKEHYGNAMKYPVIFEANRPMLEDPDRIYPGQVLRIPPLDDQ
jgi:nucleoid-associated protein YgaU